MKIVAKIKNYKNTGLMQAGTYAAVVKAINPVDKVLKDGEKPDAGNKPKAVIKSVVAAPMVSPATAPAVTSTAATA